MGIKRLLRLNLIPSVADLFFMIVLFSIIFGGKSTLLNDGDTGYHIRAGEHIIKTRSIPTFDMFSLHTPPLPWTAHEWLSEVWMALLHRLLGLTGIVAFFALLLAGTTYLLFRILRSYQTNILLATTMTILALASSQLHWLARPHLFSFLLMVIFHYLIESWHCNRENRLYLLPPIMLLWVNLHGGFVGGFILLGAYLIGNLVSLPSLQPVERQALLRKLKGLTVAIVASLAVCLINPYGYRILLFPFRLVSDRFIMNHVSEFLSPNFHEWMPFKYLLLLLIAIFALSKKTMEPTELVVILIFTNMALYSVRYVPLFALITAPILTRKADEARGEIGGRVAKFLRDRSEKMARVDARTTGHIWPATAVFTVAAAILSGQISHAFDEKVLPVAACEFLMQEKIAGNMFNSDEFGDYLIYRNSPSYRVFIDGRLDMYGSARLKEYNQVIGFEPGWESILDKYGVTWILFGSNTRFSRFLLKDRNWTLIYSDPVASIFVKKLPQHEHLTVKYRAVKPALCYAKET